MIIKGRGILGDGAVFGDIPQDLVLNTLILNEWLFINPSRTTDDLFRIKFKEDTFDIFKIRSPTGKYFETGDKIDYWMPDSNHYLQATFNGDWLWFSTNPMVFKIPSSIKSFDFRNATKSVFKILTNGNIGIGRDIPITPLHVYREGIVNTDILLENDNSATALGSYTTLILKRNSRDFDGVRSWALTCGLGSASRWFGIEDVTGGLTGASAPLVLKETNSGNVLTIAGDTVGIKTLDPTAQLDIPASTTAKASARIRTGVDPTTPNDGDIWKKTIVADGFGNPSTDNLNILNSKGTFDILAPHLSGEMIYVDSLDDFPVAPVAGELHLPTGRYTFKETGLILPYSIVIDEGNAVIFEGGTVIYVGGDTLFKSSDIGNGLLYGNQMTFADGVGNGTLFDITGDNTPNSFVRFDNSVVVYFNSLGTLSGLDAVGIFGTNHEVIGNGIILNNINLIAIFLSGFSNWQNNSTTMITVNGTNGIANIVGNTFRPFPNEKIFYFNPAATFESGVVNSNTLNLAGGGQIFQSGSKNQKDIYWTYAGNTNQPDSTTTAQGCAEVGTPITTLIPAISAQVILNLSTNWVWCNEERITTATSGIATYNGLEPITVLVDGNIELAPNLGTNQLLRTQFFKIHADDDRTVTFTNATDRINEIATPRINGDRISFYNTPGTLPTGLRKDVVYWIINKLADSFQISYTQGGAAITFPNDGTPPNYYNVAEFFGGTGRGQITNPLQFVPQSLVEISTDQQIAVAVWNATSSNDIDSLYAYYRIKK